MKNFKQEKCKQNRNYLRYLETDTFKEPPASTISKVLKNRSFIKNKKENLNSELSRLYYEVKIANKTGFLIVDISKDHLITAKAYYKKIKKIKTREMSEVVSLIEEVFFS